jgi:hypothetical protein
MEFNLRENRVDRVESDIGTILQDIHTYLEQWGSLRQRLLEGAPGSDALLQFDQEDIERCKMDWKEYDHTRSKLQHKAYAQLNALRVATTLTTRDLTKEVQLVESTQAAIGRFRQFLRITPLPCEAELQYVSRRVVEIEKTVKKWRQWDRKLKDLQERHHARGLHFPHEIEELQNKSDRLSSVSGKAKAKALLEEASSLLQSANLPLFTDSDLRSIYAGRQPLVTTGNTFAGVLDLLQSYTEQRKGAVRELNLLTHAIKRLEAEIQTHDSEQGQLLLEKALNKDGLPTIRMQPLVEIFILKPPPSVDPLDIRSNAEAQAMYTTRFVHGRLGSAPVFQRAYHWANPFTPGLSGLIYGWNLSHLCACATLIASTHVRYGLRVVLWASSKHLANRAKRAIYEQLADVNIQQLAIGLGKQPEVKDLSRLEASYSIQVGDKGTKDADVHILLLPRTRDLPPEPRAPKTFILLYDPVGSDRVDDAFRVQYALQNLDDEADVRSVERPLTERHGDTAALLRDSSRIALGALVKGRVFRLPDEKRPRVVVHGHNIPLGPDSERAYYATFEGHKVPDPLQLLRCIIDPARAKGRKLDKDKGICDISRALLTLVHTIVDQERETPEGGVQLVYTGTDYAKDDAALSLGVAQLVVRTLKRRFGYRDLAKSTQENDAVALCRSGEEWEQLLPHMGTEVRIVVVPRIQDDGFVVGEYDVSTLHTIFPILLPYELRQLHYRFQPSKQHIAFGHVSPYSKRPLGWEIVSSMRQSLVAPEEVREFVDEAAVNAAFLRTESGRS